MRHSFALLTLAAALSAQADGPPYYDPDRSLNKQSEAASAAVEAIRKGAKAEEIAGYFAEKSAEVRDRAFEAVLERSDDQALSVAQMVFTLTARPGIGRVSFTIDGEPVDVPDGSGALTSDPVAREDYDDLAPPRR